MLFLNIRKSDLKTKNSTIMKRVLVALTIASVFAACTGKPKETAVLIDTTAIKQRAVAEEQARIKAEKEENERVVAARKAAARRSSSSAPVYYTPSSNVGSSANPVSTGSGTAVTQPARQGMSSRTKGALIGGAGGAIAGGIIGKNIKGAVIGGAVGAAGGYIIGRSKDKKTGRLPSN
jgi:hypothetical protein